MDFLRRDLPWVEEGGKSGHADHISSCAALLQLSGLTVVHVPTASLHMAARVAEGSPGDPLSHCLPPSLVHIACSGWLPRRTRPVYFFGTRILNKLAWSFGKMRGLTVGEALCLVPNIKEKRIRREGETEIKMEAMSDF